MTTDETPLFRHQDEIETEFELSPTGGLPSHERRQEDESIGGGVMAAGGTATDTGEGIHAAPEAPFEPRVDLPGFDTRDEPDRDRDR